MTCGIYIVFGLAFNTWPLSGHPIERANHPQSSSHGIDSR